MKKAILEIGQRWMYQINGTKYYVAEILELEPDVRVKLKIVSIFNFRTPRSVGDQIFLQENTIFNFFEYLPNQDKAK